MAKVKTIKLSDGWAPANPGSHATQAAWDAANRYRVEQITELEHELAVAEQKAWDSLSRYKFAMFGYWAGIWVHLNRVGEFGRPNPWKSVVHVAREHQRLAATAGAWDVGLVVRMKGRRTTADCPVVNCSQACDCERA